MVNKLIIFLGAFWVFNQLPAQETLDVFYFAVGSEHYERDPSSLEPGFRGLRRVRGAAESARRVKTLLDNNGAVAGEIMVSEDFVFITRDKLLKGLKNAIRKAQKAKAKTPFFIFYYCGHGFTNGELQAMFLPPGNLTGDLTKFNHEDWLDNTISPLEIREMLEASGLRYMIILDCCYEGDLKETEFLNPSLIKLTGTETFDQLMKDTYRIVIALNQMIGPDPTLFSTLSGKSVAVVTYSFADGIQKVGPLCRRMYKVFEEKMKGNSLMLSDFMVMMEYEALDDQTTPAVSYWSMDENAFNYLREE